MKNMEGKSLKGEGVQMSLDLLVSRVLTKKKGQKKEKKKKKR